jgi:MYXO-CTERM domain-containing protein
MKATAFVLLALAPATVHAYTLASPITTGCHERLTSAALRQVRADLAIPPLPPLSADEQALIADLPFLPEPDMRDLAAAALLLGVRDNDLKGNDIKGGVDLVQVHGDPASQREHCLRAPHDDEPGGAAPALSACRDFIRDTALAALEGLDATGLPDPTRITSLAVSLAIRGRIDTRLPAFYVRAGQAMHALQDSFTHTFRIADGTRVTAVLNWVDFAEEQLVERRDGPAHLIALDACEHLDAMRDARLKLAAQHSAALLHTLLDPRRSPADKATAIDATLNDAITLEPGCTFDNLWCDAPERGLASEGGCGCAVAYGGAGAMPEGIALLLALAIAASLRRPASTRHRPRATGTALIALAMVALSAAGPRAEELDADDVPLTTAELAALRDVRASGPRFGIAASVGGSLDRSAAVGALGGRFRLSSRWVVGADVEWNPWIATYPVAVHAGAFNAYGTLIRRYPMRFERVNLRTTLHVGMSVLLFDVYGARAGSVGPYLGIAPLGIDVHLRRGWKLVLDPLTLDIPIPHLTGVPLYYEQFRLIIGLQYGG